MSSPKCIRRLLYGGLVILGVSILNPGVCSSAPIDSICNNVQLGPMGAGGRPQFRIFLQGACNAKYLDSESQLADPSETGWKETYFFGSYNYDTGEAAESIYLMDGVLLEIKLNCRANPWAHGVQGGGACSVLDISKTSKGKNTAFPGPYPFSAFLLSDGIKLGLQKWETTTPTDQLLTDWDPYAGSQGTNRIFITSPTSYEVVPETISEPILIDVVMNKLTSEKFTYLIKPDNIDIISEKRVKSPEWLGDINVPESMTHIWERCSENFNLDVSRWPLFMNPGVGCMKSPGLIRVKVRYKGILEEMPTNWSNWHYFWYGEPEKLNIDGIHKAVPIPFVVSPSTAVVFGLEGGVSSFMVEHGKPPYNITTDNANFSPQPVSLQSSGSIFSVHVPAGTSPVIITYKITDQANQTETVKLSIATAQSQELPLGGFNKNLAASSPVPIPEGVQVPMGRNEVVKTGPLREVAPPVRKGIVPVADGHSAPTPLPLPRGAAFSVNSLTSLPVKHTAGQRPEYEFEYYDGRAWRKERSIRPISIQTPQGNGMTQVITKSSFRITKPGKYRYRVKTDWPGASFSPYREFVVVDPRAAKSMAQANAQSSRAKADAEHPSAAGVPPSKMDIAKSPAKVSKSSPPANSADLLQGKDSASPQVKAQRQLMPPSTPPKITFPRTNQSFFAPANVMVKTSHDSRFGLVFEVRKDAGKFLKAKSGDLRKLSIGKYRVKVGYKGAPQSSQVTFEVKMPIKKQAVKTQPRPQKAPATQPTLQPQKQPAPKPTTPQPIRRSVSPQ